jgi:hypothetical protein
VILKQLSKLANNIKTSSAPNPNKIATYIQTPANFICTSHQRTPMQSTTPQSLYIKGHEATTKKCFGNKHPNLLYHDYGWKERERSPGTLTP